MTAFSQKQNGLGPYLRALRSERNLSMSALAQKAGVNQSTLSRWEAGKTQPYVVELDAVLKALSVSKDQRKQALSLVDAPRAVKAIFKEKPVSEWERIAGNAPQGGDLLKAMRLRKRLRLEDLASLLGVSHTTLSRWERSEMWPDEQKLHHICFLLDADEKELLALTAGPFVFDPNPLPDRQARETLSQRYDDLFVEGDILLKNKPLSLEVTLLAYESQLWQHARKQEWARDLLYRVYAKHAHLLSLLDRFGESLAIANRAFDIRLRSRRADDSDWLVAFAAGRSVTQHKGKKGAKQAREIVTHWIDTIDASEFLAWGYANLGSYEAMEGNMEGALALMRKSCEIAKNFNSNPSEYRRRVCDQAMLISKAKTPQHALRLLEKEVPPTHDFVEAWTYAELSLRANDKTAAQNWIKEFKKHVAHMGVDHLQDYLHDFERRL